MEPVRVVLGKLPPLLADIVRGLLAAEPGIAVLAEAADGASLAAAVLDHRPDVVVLEAEAHGGSPALRRLVCDLPDVTWMTLARDHSRVTVRRLRRTELADPGPRDLVAAIHAAAPPG